MKKNSKRKLGALLGVLAAMAALGALIVSGAAGETVKLGNLEISIEGGITPKKLPKKGKAPITLKVEGQIKTNDGSHVPVLKTINLQFDKNGELNTTGLPTCDPAKIQSTLTAQAKKICGSALVGTGKVSAEIAFPEQKPFDASGPLLIFNGKPKGANRTLVFHVYAHVPAPTTFVTEALIKKIHGKYGTEAQIKIPTIVSGQGSLTSFKATLNKTWTYKGKKESLLLAGCPNGSLAAHGEFLFATGAKLSGNILRPCTPGK
jgi:hypothetical protein